MNKIYRKVWCTARQCWVVASELTTARGKASPAVRLGVPAGMALSLLLGSASLEVSAATAYMGCDANTGGGTVRCIPFASSASAARNYASGNAFASNFMSMGAGAWADGNMSTAIGIDSRANGDNSSVFGYRAKSTHGYSSAFGAMSLAEDVGASAFGNNAWARGQNSIAFGSGAQTAFGGGTDRIAIGGDAYAGSSGYTGAISIGGNARSNYDGVSLGFQANAQAAGAVALGKGARAQQNDSIAIGRDSLANQANTVSVGNATNKRRIVNVADGAVSSTSFDAVNGRTLQREKDVLNTSINTVRSTANTAKVTADQALAKANTNSYAVATGSAITNSTKAVASGNQALALGELARADGAAAAAIGQGAKAYNTNSIAMGADARAGVDAAGEKAAVTGAVALGAGSRSGNGAVAAGLRASAVGDRAVAMGNDAKADSVHATAVGFQASASSGQASAFGRGADASGTYSVSVGNLSKASAQNAVALGHGANASHSGSVALGNGSVTTGNNQISVGNASTQRRIINVGDGSLSASSTDAVTGRQLFATNSNVTTAQNTANSAVAKADALGRLIKQVSPTGVVHLGAENTGLILTVSNKDGEKRFLNGVRNGTLSATSSDAVTGQQLFATNSNVTTAQNTANSAVAKADALGGLVKQVSPTGAVHLGAENAGAVLTVSNKDGDTRYLNGVRNGTLSATSSDAVTGQQLFATNNNVTTAQNTATAAQRAAGTAQTTADSALAKADALNGLVSEVSGSGNVRLGGENTGNVVDVANKNGGKRRVYNIADGVVSRGSTDAVTGSQLFATNELVRVQGETLTAHDGRIADNRSELQKLRGEFENFDPDLDGVVKFDADGHVDVAGGKVKGVAAGDISFAGSTDGVNGGQLFLTNERVGQVEKASEFISVDWDADSSAAQSSSLAIAIGSDSKALGIGATAIGSYSEAWATNSVSVGRGSRVLANADSGFSLGSSSEVAARYGVAIGAASQVTAAAENSVAIGATSVVKEANTVSFGNDSLRRRLANVSRGIGATDATTVAQLNETLAALGGGARVDVNGDVVSPTYDIQGATQKTVGDALVALDSAVVAGDARVGRVENQLRSVFQEGPSVRADGLGQLNLFGANGMVLSNLADGRVAAGSRDAVTGNQLFEVKQDIERNRLGLEDLRADHGRVSSRRLLSSQVGAAIDFGGSRLTGVADGVVSSDSQDAVTGSQLYSRDARIDDLEKGSRYLAVWSDQDSVAARAGLMGVAIGDGAFTADGAEGGTALGSYSSAQARDSVALGRGANVDGRGEQGLAALVGSNVYAKDGIAIGAYSRVEQGASGSLALGATSVANEAGIVSFGHANLKRRLVNVANGRNATDAATVGQLRGALASLGGDIDANGNIINPTFNVQGGQRSTLNDALATLDSAVIIGTQRVDRVESQLRSVFQEGPSVRSDGLSQLNLAGANGMVLSNVANGYVGAGSRDAVNGGQLYSLQQQLNGRVDGLEQRLDGQPQAPQSRALTIASADAGAPAAVPAASPEPETPATPPPSAADNKVADNGTPPPPTPQADAPKPEAPTPQVDTAELEKMLARANEYSDGISREVDRRLDKMDKRFNRMAAMSSAQSAMAMNTAGLNTYNRLGAGVGYSEGESAMAVGYQRVLNDKGSATFSLNGAFTNSGERSMGVGVGIGW
ncbi:ESPR-type extended signal peptide-containing protein [Stenotrophomonas sp.]|uniref:ESPR-type extended signal peptide-containing protein n=1 Tax=Stenotrophomonas sp. TaxID=69392 RepID=UPI0028A1A47D|nr:ESPR-type extended signal peptide-containing protein [Stenotrophomonas sp.]